MRGLILVALCSLILLPACRAIQKEAKMELAKPVECATAPQDLAILKKDKASVEKRFLEGVTAITPYGAVIGILTLQEKDKLEVAIGVYNHRLQRKIEEIQDTCEIE